MMARRLDAAMAAMGLVPSREQAARLIRDGQVMVNGVVTNRPSTQMQVISARITELNETSERIEIE